MYSQLQSTLNTAEIILIVLTQTSTQKACCLYSYFAPFTQNKVRHTKKQKGNILEEKKHKHNERPSLS